MKTRLLLIVTVLALGVGGWYFFSKKNASISQIERLIPATSIGVLSIEDAGAQLKSWSKFDWWDELAALPLFESGLNTINGLDSLKIKSDLTGLPVYISFHITANDQLQSVYLVESNGFNWQLSSLKTILERWYGGAQVAISERNYLNRSLFDVKAGQAGFSFFIEGNYLAISSNALLVEDVVRAAEQGTSLLAGQEYSLNSTGSEVSLLLDCGRLNDLMRVFSTQKTGVSATDGLYLQMDVEPGQNGFVFNGRSVIFKNLPNEEEANLDLKNFVPANASVVKWYGMDKRETQEDAFDINRFRQLHEGDLCLLDIELNNITSDKVMLASVNDGDEARRILTSLAELRKDASDTLFRESFMDTEIIYINYPGLPKALYGDRFDGFEQTYFTVYNNVLFFGNGIDALKAVLGEYDAENTWGRSIERRRYIDNLVQEANLTALYNFEYLLERLNSQLKPRWKNFFSERPELTGGLDLLALQVSNTGSGMLVNASLSFNESVSGKSGPETIVAPAAAEVPDPLINSFADTLIATRLYVVRNHDNNEREMIFQDEATQLYLVSDQGVVQWKREIGAKINGDISQIDYYNNRKLQYFFLTDSAIHLVDRNGEDVEGFPKSISTILPLKGHRVVDYDNTRRYRYATADRRGNVYLFDKEGNLLEGWDPKPMGSQLMDLPEHVRIRGRDCFVMVENQGTIHLTNRRGEYYPGFPFNTGKRLAGDVVITKGADFARSRIVVSSDNGEVISLNFDGKIASRNQLLRPGANSRFRLVRDKLNNGFAIVRRDANRLFLFNSAGDQLFSVPVATGDTFDVNFYNFRNDNEVFAVWNQTQGRVQVYNNKGRSITGGSLVAHAPVGIIYYQSRAEYELFVNFANQLTLYRVPK